MMPIRHAPLIPCILQNCFNLWGGERKPETSSVSCSCSCSAVVTGFARARKNDTRGCSWLARARANPDVIIVFFFVLVVCLLVCLFVLVCSCSCFCSCCCCCCRCCCCCCCYCCTRSCTVFDCVYRPFLLFCSYMFAPPLPHYTSHVTTPPPTQPQTDKSHIPTFCHKPPSPRRHTLLV